MMAQEPEQAQQKPPIQIMQSVTIQPKPKFSPDVKIGPSFTDFDMYLTASGITDLTGK